jgi:signal transduction histidine kinase
MLPDFRIRQRDYLLEIARALTQELDLKKLLGRILNISVEMLAGQAGIILLRAETGKWQVAATHGIPQAFLTHTESILEQIDHGDDPLNTEVPEINRQLQDATYSASLGFLTGVGLPLVVRQQVIGIIFIFRSYPDVFSNNDRVLLSSFGSQAAIAVHNAMLYTQVHQEKQRLDALLDSAADGILILSPDKTIERANIALGRFLALRPSHIVSKKHDQVIRWAKPPQGTPLEIAEAGGWPLTPQAYLYVEGDLVRKDQPPLPVGITYAPLFSPEGVLVNIIATVRDITRFRQADELKSTFISVISHELKTPVALIKGYVSTLRRDDATWDRAVVQDSLAVIEDEADRLTEMIENMLDASRLQAGGLNIKLADVNLAEVARRLVERFQTQTNRHTLVSSVPADFPIILGDETRLEQVLSNLISNAIKYAPEGEICVSGEARPNQVILCVSDHGPGIAQEDIPHVFDRFYRAPSAVKQTKGAGLGLYLASQIVEAHGGKMWVDPKPEEGAKICFSLPRE